MSSNVETTEVTPVEESSPRDGTAIDAAIEAVVDPDDTTTATLTVVEPVGSSVIEAVRAATAKEEVVTNAVDLNLKTDTIDFQMRTQTSMTVEAVDLAARLETAMILLRETTAKLENALYRIGFMEGQIELLKSQKSERSRNDDAQSRNDDS